LCPTAPDTLRCFPFREDDPFVIERAPDVLFAGCQPTYSEKLIYQHAKSKESAVKLVSIPTFALSRSIVLIDLETLQSYELSFGKKLDLQDQ
jgi:DNA polymerase delta subunit 2